MRDLKKIKRLTHVNGCCPGHDDWPDGVYSSNRSKRARSRDIAREHRYVRRVQKHNLKKESDHDEVDQAD